MSCSCEIETPQENLNKKDAELYSLLDFFFKTMDTGDLVNLNVQVMSPQGKKMASHVHRGKKINSNYHITHSLGASKSNTSDLICGTESYKHGLIHEINKLNSGLSSDPHTVVQYNISTSTIDDIMTVDI